MLSEFIRLCKLDAFTRQKFSNIPLPPLYGSGSFGVERLSLMILGWSRYMDVKRP